MKSVAVIFLFASFYGSLILAIPVSINGEISINFKPVAVVDGKTFIADLTVRRTWAEAAKFCSDNGMNLADILTEAEANTLRIAYSPGDFNTSYWTAARDAHQTRQFTWDTTGGELSTTFNSLGGLYQNLTYQTCLFYWSKPNNESELYMHKCDEKAGTLCSTQIEGCKK